MKSDTRFIRLIVSAGLIIPWTVHGQCHTPLIAAALTGQKVELVVVDAKFK